MAGKRKQMSTPQKEVVISLFEDGVNQRRIAEILLGVSQSGV
jgi:predicted transcriptional regulator